MRCYLKYIKHEITLNVYSPDRKVANMPLDSSTALPLYKGTDSIIDFIIKDNDRKPVSMIGKTLHAYIMNVATKQHMLTIPLYPIDDLKGFYQIVISKDEIQQWDNDYYHLVVTMIDERGIEQPLFNEYGYHTQSVLKINEMVMDYFKSSIETIPSEWLLTVDDDYVSSAYPIINETTTVALYLDNYFGDIEIQTSIADVSPSSDLDWTTLYTYSYENYTGLEYKNIVGKYKWIRIKHKYNVSNVGTFEKVLIRS